MSIEERYSYLRRMHDRYLSASRRERAGLLGGIIGWEREMHEKPAGLRTVMLVSLAAKRQKRVQHFYAELRQTSTVTVTVAPLA